MKKGSLFLILFVFSLKSIAQVDSSYRYSSNGVFYKVFKNEGGKHVPYKGNIQYSMEQFYNDSLLADTKSSKMVMSIDSVILPPYYYAGLKDINEGDSIVFRLATDSSKKIYAPFEWIKPGSFLNTYFKVEKLFATEAEADIAMIKFDRANKKKDSIVAAAQTAFESSKIIKYLTTKSLTYTRTLKGDFIVISKSGNGKKITPQSIVKLNYTGKTFAGKIFDSNTDSAFQHVKPYDVDLNDKKAVIQGWQDGLLGFTEGSKGTLYIPSPLAYGKAGYGSRIGPDEILVFDIEILSVKNPPAVPAVKKPVPSTTPKPKTTAVKKV